MKSRMNINRGKAKTAQERADELTGDNSRSIDLRAGQTLLLMHLPSTDPQIHDPVRFLQVHHKPFHVCLTGDAVDVGTKFKTSLSFDDCPRCKPVWAAWRAEGFTGTSWEEYVNHPLDARRKQIGEEKSKIKGVAQVIDVTPFFTIEGEGDEMMMTPSDERMALMDDFVSIMAGETPKTPIDKLPKDFVEAAKQGITYLTGAQTNLKRLVSAHKKKTASFRREHKDNDLEPLEYPDKVLLELTLTKTGEYQGNDKLEWGCNYVDHSKAGWTVSDRFYDVMMERLMNLHKPSVPEGATADDYNAVLAPMPADMLSAYLAEKAWVMSGPDGGQSPPDRDDEDPGYDPDADRYAPAPTKGVDFNKAAANLAAKAAERAAQQNPPEVQPADGSALRNRMKREKPSLDDNSFE
jgi:hypothetical protein